MMNVVFIIVIIGAVINVVSDRRLRNVHSRTECRRVMAAVQRTTSLGCWSLSCWSSLSVKLPLSSLNYSLSCSVRRPRPARVHSSSTSVSAICSSSPTRRWTSSFTVSAAGHFDRSSWLCSAAVMSLYLAASRRREHRSAARPSLATVAACCRYVPDRRTVNAARSRPVPRTSRCSR